MKEIWETRIDGLKVSIKQQSKERFAIQYGLSLKTGLSWESAAFELGLCILHGLQCAGKLDEEEGHENTKRGFPSLPVPSL